MPQCPNSYWLIDSTGGKTPTYRLHQQYYQAARTYVQEYVDESGRTPSWTEFSKQAQAILKSIVVA